MTKWTPAGHYQRYALWPKAGDVASFDARQPEWTAFYRWDGLAREQQGVDAGEPAFYQVFVCEGAIEVSDRRFGAGDFFCDYFGDRQFASLPAASGTTLVVKRQDHVVHRGMGYRPRSKRRADYRYVAQPWVYPRTIANGYAGMRFDVKTSFLYGRPLRTIDSDMTVVTQLERFDEHTVAPSHYHESPVWHEFIYLQGGHITPEAYYAQGDHIASIPGCKEGPYFACSEETRAYPPLWPTPQDPSSLARAVPKTWGKIFTGSEEGVYGILFVHHGPFAHGNPFRLDRKDWFDFANWTLLGAGEMVA